MERRGSGMGGMMPFFPGPGIGDQPPLPPPDMPPFPHMRERFPNAVWGGEGPPQGQWPPSFHPPGLPHPPMGHPAHPPPPHQFNQFEPRQSMFNFSGGPGAPTAPTPSVPVSQYNQAQYNNQFNTSTDATTGGYVPQGHFSPQTTASSVPAFTNQSGPPNGYLTHSQGNGLMGGSSPHHHQYPGSNEFQQHQQHQMQQQQQQGGMFKSPLPSPAISAPESSPVTGGFTMTTLPSPHAPHTPYSNPDTPHATEHPNEKPGYLPPPPTQNSLDSRVSPVGGYSGPVSEGGSGVTVGMSVSVPQSSPHGHVQSRLKSMIMSRQGGSGFQGSGGGPVDSPPLGEVHFSGSVSAVTSPVDAEPQQMHESLKMAQNFLAYRTTGSGPDPVVRPNNTHEEGGVNVAMASTTNSNNIITNTAITVSSGLTSLTTTNSTQALTMSVSCSNSSMHSVKMEPKQIGKDNVNLRSNKCNKMYDAEAHSNIDPKPPDESTKQVKSVYNVDKLGGMCLSKPGANSNKSSQNLSNESSNSDRNRNKYDALDSKCVKNEPPDGNYSYQRTKMTRNANTSHFPSNVRTVHSGTTSPIVTSVLPEAGHGALAGSNPNLPSQQDFRLGRDRGAGFQRPVCADAMGAKAWPHGQQPPTRSQLSSTVGGGLRPRGPSAPAFQNPTPNHVTTIPNSQLPSNPHTPQQYKKLDPLAKNGISSIRMQQLENKNMQIQHCATDSVQHEKPPQEFQNLLKQQENQHASPNLKDTNMCNNLQSQPSAFQIQGDQKLFQYHQDIQRMKMKQQNQLELQNLEFREHQIKKESTDLEVQRQVDQIHQTMRMKNQKQDDVKIQAMQCNEINKDISFNQSAKTQFQQPMQIKQEPEELRQQFDNLKNQHSPGQQQFQKFLEQQQQSQSQQEELKREQARKQEFERQQEIKFKQRQSELEKQRKLFENEQKIRRERDKEQQRMLQKQREEFERDKEQQRIIQRHREDYEMQMQMRRQHIKQEPSMFSNQQAPHMNIKREQEPSMFSNQQAQHMNIKREQEPSMFSNHQAQHMNIKREPGMQNLSNTMNFDPGIQQKKHYPNEMAIPPRQPGPLDHLKQLGVPQVSNNIQPRPPMPPYTQVKQEAEKRPAEEPSDEELRDKIRDKIRELEGKDPIGALKERMKLNETEVPHCNCHIPTGAIDPGPIYTHLGCGSTLPELRQKLENQIGHSGKALRIEKVKYTGIEGKTESGCPLPKWIIRRSGCDEKALVVVKQRPYHMCNASWICIALVAWEGIPLTVADGLYSNLVYKLNRYGNPTERRCGTNDERTCICQGFDPEACGASFSFGCSWSMYYNACKFARSRTPRKYKLTAEHEEKELENRLEGLATYLSPLYQKYCPKSYSNMCALETDSTECRLGFGPGGKPWSGVTACMDFCAHSHKDNHNINNGCTAVATLTKWRGPGKPPDGDEQLHVLPLYVLDPTDECNPRSTVECQKRVTTGALEVLNKYPREILLRSEPLLSNRAKACLLKGLPLPNTRGRGRGRGAAAYLRGRGRGRGRGRESEFLMNMKMNEVSIPDTDLNSELPHTDDLIGVDTNDLLNSEGFDIEDYNWLLDIDSESDLSAYSNLDYLLSNSSSDYPEMDTQRPGGDSDSNLDIHLSNSSSEKTSELDNDPNRESQVQGDASKELKASQVSLPSESQYPISPTSSSSANTSTSFSDTPSEGFRAPSPSSCRSVMPPPQSPAPRIPSSPRPCASPVAATSPSNTVNNPSLGSPHSNLPITTSVNSSAIPSSLQTSAQAVPSPQQPMSPATPVLSPSTSAYKGSPAAPVLSPSTSIYSPLPNTPSQIPVLSPIAPLPTVSQSTGILHLPIQSVAQNHPSEESTVPLPSPSLSTVPPSSPSSSHSSIPLPSPGQLNASPHSPGQTTIMAPSPCYEAVTLPSSSLSSSDQMPESSTVCVSESPSPHSSHLPHLAQSPLCKSVNNPIYSHSLVSLYPSINKSLSHDLPRSLPSSPLGSLTTQVASSVSLPASPLSKSLPSSPKPQNQTNYLSNFIPSTLPISDKSYQPESQIVNSQIMKLQSEKEINLPYKSELDSKLGLSTIKEDPDCRSGDNSVTSVDMAKSLCSIKNENSNSEINNKNEIDCPPFSVKVEIPGQPLLEIKQETNQSQFPSSNIQQEYCKPSLPSPDIEEIKHSDSSKTPTTTAPIAYLPYYPFTPINRMVGNIPTGPPRPPFGPISPSVNTIQPRMPQSSFRLPSNSPALGFSRPSNQEGINNNFQTPPVKSFVSNHMVNKSNSMQNTMSFENRHPISTNEINNRPFMNERNPMQFMHQNSMNSYPEKFDNSKLSISEKQRKLAMYDTEIIRKFTDNIHNFYDQNVGGVALALSHGSVLFECAKHELHATTALKNPDRRDPKRISLVFYQHKALIHREHGMEYFEGRMDKKRNEELRLIKEGKLVPSPRKKKKLMREGIVFPEDDMEPAAMSGFMKHNPGLKKKLMREGFIFPEENREHAGMNGFMKHNPGLNCIPEGNRFPHPNNIHPRFPHHPAFRSPPNGFPNFNSPYYNPRAMGNPAQSTYPRSPYLCNTSYVRGTLDSLENHVMKPQFPNRPGDMPSHMPHSQARQMLPTSPSQDAQISSSITGQGSSPYLSPRQVSPYPSPRQISPYPSPRQISPYQSPNSGQMQGNVSQSSPYLSSNNAVQQSPTNTFQQASSFQPYHQQTNPTPALHLHSPKQNFPPQFSPHNPLPLSSPTKHPLQHSPNPIISQHSPNQGHFYPGMVKNSAQIPNQNCGPYHNFMTSQPPFGMTPPYSPGAGNVPSKPSINPIYTNSSTGNS